MQATLEKAHALDWAKRGFDRMCQIDCKAYLSYERLGECAGCKIEAWRTATVYEHTTLVNSQKLGGESDARENGEALEAQAV